MNELRSYNEVFNSRATVTSRVELLNVTSERWREIHIAAIRFVHKTQFKSLLSQTTYTVSQIPATLLFTYRRLFGYLFLKRIW